MGFFFFVCKLLALCFQIQNGIKVSHFGVLAYLPCLLLTSEIGSGPQRV